MSDPPILTPNEITTLVRAALDGTPGGLTKAELEQVYQWALKVRIDAALLDGVLRRELLITVPVDDDADLRFSIRVAGHG